MRVGHVSFYYWPISGGQEVYIANLNRVLERHGHTATVYQPLRAGARSAPSIVATPNPAVLVKLLDRLELWPWQWHVFTRMLAVTQQRRLRREDVLICHYAVHSPALRAMRRKTIVLSHGIEWNRANPTRETRLREAIARRAFARFTTVANDTEYLRHFGLDVAPGTRFFEEVAPGRWFIPNCVDTEVFAPRPATAAFDGRAVVLVPRPITKDRGVDLALRAFRQVSERHPDLFLYVVGGPLWGRHYEHCRWLAGDLGIRERVVFMGAVDHDAMPALYASARVALVPTLRREGTSLSALESMACGTPTVSTNVEGLKDLPTVHAAPEAGDVAEKLLATLRQPDAVAERQLAAVRATFNLRNWERAWLEVIAAVAGRC